MSALLSSAPTAYAPAEMVVDGAGRGYPPIDEAPHSPVIHAASLQIAVSPKAIPKRELSKAQCGKNGSSLWMAAIYREPFFS